MARIGLVTQCFQRGHWYVTECFAHAVTELGHEPFYFVRQGFVYGHPMRADWALPNRHDHPTYEIEPGALRAWAQYHTLDAVVFNEEHDFALPMAVQQAGIKTVQYVDAYLARSWRPLLKFYDQLWCVTHRSEAILHGWNTADRTHYVGWGVRPEHIGAHVGAWPRVDFMHSAGWIGIDGRKGTREFLEALALMDDDPPEVLLHCQLPEEAAKQVLGWEHGLPAHIIWEDADVPPPGLYHMGRVCVQPSKLEGFGLSVVEALCAGRPVITVDAAPMHEFVTPDTGWLVPVDRWQPHPDGSLYEQSLVTPESLVKAMQEAHGLSDAAIREKSKAALSRARQLFDWQAFKDRLAEGLARIDIA